MDCVTHAPMRISDIFPPFVRAGRVPAPWRCGRSLLAALACLALAEPALAAGGSTTVIPAITVEPDGSGLTISATATALAPVKVSAQLSIERQGRSGNVTTRQSRALDLTKGESGDIARTRVSFGGGDSLEVRVEIRDGDGVIARTGLALGPAAAGR